MSIGKKIAALVAVLVLFTASTAAGYHALVVRVRDMAIRQTSELMLQDYRNELKDLVDAMAATLAAATDTTPRARRSSGCSTRWLGAAAATSSTGSTSRAGGCSRSSPTPG
jgi:hypothetical protein